MTPKRQKVQDFVLGIISTIDPSDYNGAIYRALFDSMNDQAFDKWMISLRDNPHAKMKLMVPPFKVVLSPGNCLKAAKALNIEIMERIRLWDPVGNRYTMTPEKYFILHLPVRRLKQYLMNGLSVPESDKRLNPLTDQVVKPDKGSAISFPQAQMIAEKGLTTTLHELMTIRGGDLEAYARMRSEIEETGDSDTSVMQGTDGTKSSQTLRSFLYAMHLDNNI